ncbi:MAG: SpoIID/LytB domain-containing protein [Clostridiales bacterium]|jgi:stage II sporulation protein D|nr:SpoIID/LytB domain-containing protein [Clostridiales bacterium]
MLKRLLLLLTFVMFLAACRGNTEYDEFDEPFVADGVALEERQLEPAWDDAPILRASVARMVALTFSDSAAINQAPRIINFADSTPEDWFDKYINKAYTLGHLSGAGGYFYPNEPLTLEHAQLLLERLNPNNTIRIQLSDENRHMAVSYALWVNLYMQMLEDLQARGYAAALQTVDAVVLITPGFNGNLPAGNIVTNRGAFNAAGLDFEGFLDVELNLLVRGNSALAIVGVLNYTPTLQNVFIVERNSESISIFSGGAGRTYAIDAAISANLPQGRIGDITIDGGRVTAVRLFSQSQSGVVLEVGADFIEIEGLGRISTHGNFSIFSLIGGQVALGRPGQITIGYDVADFVMREGEIAAAIVLRRPTPEHIRVLLMTTGFAGRIHDHVELRSAGGLRVYAPEGVIELAPGEVFRVDALNSHLLGGERVRIEPAGGYKIEILSIRRNWPGGANPQYRGIIEISGRAGGFVVVNQLLLEEYLFAVIPSEMPTAFGLEAAKVQAVTARSYAYNQFFANRLHAYGANVCDSVMTQVYNNIPETDIAIAAVNYTRGLVLTYNNRVVSANYFSTSSGHTADRGDVWLNSATGRLDGETPPYLAGRPQLTGADFGDLSQEQNAREFFMDTTIVAYDSESPWFRWNFQLTAEQLGRIINGNLPRLAQVRPHNFRPLDTPQFPPGFAMNIGDFRGMEVGARGRGGNVNELIIHGSAASLRVITEFSIRELLTPQLPEGIPLNRHNAAPVNNHFILPSTFMTFEENDGIWRFYGGGFGHGVGMSQHGAYGKIRRGYDFRQILAHFYPGTVLTTQ